jgi:hypothetical protein
VGGAPLSCTYAGLNGVGARLYNVTYNYNAVTDVGCVGLSSTPYWAQLSNSAAANGAGNYNNAWNADNTWQAGAAGLTSSLTNIVEGTTIYAHAKSRDGLDNQSTVGK